MKKTFKQFVFTFLVSAGLASSMNASAQSEVLNNVKAAIKAGSSKELVKNFNSMVELNFEGTKSNYSRSQAELVMKEFFKKYPPQNFQYIHQGSSKEGLTYVIGKYNYESGSFRVWILVKKIDSKFVVELINFNKE
jgi:hypothetical protein